LVMQLP